MGQKASAEPRKVRWTLPAADVSVSRWLDLQDNISQSLRLLIRESIQRDGYIDVAYKPVEQLTSQGRPSQAEARAEPGDAHGRPQGFVERDDRGGGGPTDPAVAAPSRPPHRQNGGQVDMDDIFGHGS